jgi:hypothetical protein
MKVKKRYSISRIDYLLHQLRGAKYFSKIDLNYDYYQVPIELIDVWKTTFKSKEGVFRWLFMPFGLTDSPTTFTRLMAIIDLCWGSLLFHGPSAM